MGDWVRVGPLDELEPGTAAKAQLGKATVALVRIGDDVYAIGDICSHANVSLSDGEIHDDTCEIECWKHGSAFSLKTGEPSSLPATRAVPVFDVKIEDGDIYLRAGS